MKRKILFVKVLSIVFCVVLLSFSLTACNKSSNALTYKANSVGSVPISAGEAALQTVTASLYLHISDSAKTFLEGTVFDKDGNLYFNNCMEETVVKVTPDKKITSFPTISGASIKIDRDGRLYICSLGNFVDSGSIVSYNADGSDAQVVIPSTAGYVPDEMVFRSDGSFYFCDFKGTVSNPIGGVYYVSADRKTITPVLQNLASPNGLVLSADESILYITEMGQNRLLRVGVSETTPIGCSVPYYFNGEPGCDSATIDSDDNIYVAMFQQGRLLVFNSNGYPIGQILMPDRDSGANLWVTHCAFIPGTNQLIICCADIGGTNGINLYIVNGFAKGAAEYQLQ